MKGPTKTIEEWATEIAGVYPLTGTMSVNELEELTKKIQDDIRLALKNNKIKKKDIQKIIDMAAAGDIFEDIKNMNGQNKKKHLFFNFTNDLEKLGN